MTGSTPTIQLPAVPFQAFKYSGHIPVCSKELDNLVKTFLKLESQTERTFSSYADDIICEIYCLEDSCFG